MTWSQGWQLVIKEKRAMIHLGTILYNPIRDYTFARFGTGAEVTSLEAVVR